MTFEERIKRLQEDLREHARFAKQCADEEIYGWRTRQLDSEFKLWLLDGFLAQSDDPERLFDVALHAHWNFQRQMIERLLEVYEVEREEG